MLRSRYPSQKRRRGKQGHQVNGYQDVALKTEHNPGERTFNVAGPSVVVIKLPPVNGDSDRTVNSPFEGNNPQISTLKWQSVRTVF